MVKRSARSETGVVLEGGSEELCRVIRRISSWDWDLRANLEDNERISQGTISILVDVMVITCGIRKIIGCRIGKILNRSFTGNRELGMMDCSNHVSIWKFNGKYLHILGFYLQFDSRDDLLEMSLDWEEFTPFGYFKKEHGFYVPSTSTTHSFSFKKSCEHTSIYGERMTQSLLLGKEVERQGGGGNRKRLKITVAHFDNTDLIRSYAKTLVGRCMNPEKQKVESLLVMLPKIWKMEDRVVGVDLGMGRFQFHFDTDEDIETVLELQPFHFDFWMLSLGRWKQRMPATYPSEIPFWIKVIGVPSEFWSTEMFQSIGDAIGVTTDVDIDYGRIRVIKDGLTELCFDTTINFKGGDFYEEMMADVTLQFEKLFGYCQSCLSLCHHQDLCPLTRKKVEKQREERTKERNGLRDERGGMREDRARSYSGVVINGDGGYKESFKDQRGYQGKGKGKMFEEWTKVEDRGSKRSYPHRSQTRLEDGDNRSRSLRGDAPIMVMEGRRLDREDRKEEGEINIANVERSMVLQEQHLITDTKQGGETNLELNMAKKGTVEAEDQSQDVDGLELEGLLFNVEGENANLESEDDFENLTDEEGSKEEIREPGEANELTEKVEEMEINGGELEKKEGARRGLFATSGPTNKKFVNALLSPRKRFLAKQGARKGGGPKQGEGKGTSNPKHNLKP